MPIPKELGSIKRFGARYGRKIKEKLAKIENLYHKKLVCPHCNAKKVKRKAPGIWHCMRCNATFAGKAYTFSKTVAIREELELEVAADESKQNQEA